MQGWMDTLSSSSSSAACKAGAGTGVGAVREQEGGRSGTPGRALGGAPLGPGGTPGEAAQQPGGDASGRGRQGEGQDRRAAGGAPQRRERHGRHARHRRASPPRRQQPATAAAAARAAARRGSRPCQAAKRPAACLLCWRPIWRRSSRSRSRSRSRSWPCGWNNEDGADGPSAAEHQSPCFLLCSAGGGCLREGEARLHHSPHVLPDLSPHSSFRWWRHPCAARWPAHGVPVCGLGHGAR
eukprot:jgi/Mesen1/7483/ME000039S06711